MSEFRDIKTGLPLRSGAMNDDDAHKYGIPDSEAARIAETAIRDSHRPYGVGPPTGERHSTGRWAGLDRGRYAWDND